MNTPESLLEFFDAIPEEKWCIDTYDYGPDPSKHCALGHCRASGLGKEHGLLEPNINVDFTCINDGNFRFMELGDHPKERVINALILMIAGLWEIACGEDT
jgi:hypothetical protein